MIHQTKQVNSASAFIKAISLVFSNFLSTVNSLMMSLTLRKWHSGNSSNT